MSWLKALASALMLRGSRYKYKCISLHKALKMARQLWYRRFPRAFPSGKAQGSADSGSKNIWVDAYFQFAFKGFTQGNSANPIGSARKTARFGMVWRYCLFVKELTKDSI